MDAQNTKNIYGFQSKEEIKKQIAKINAILKPVYAQLSNIHAECEQNKYILQSYFLFLLEKRKLENQSLHFEDGTTKCKEKQQALAKINSTLLHFEKEYNYIINLYKKKSFLLKRYSNIIKKRIKLETALSNHENKKQGNLNHVKW